ncbi:hypothetical protein [Actinoplanes regularis]|uniref:Uncharacterized protein n=1 Tax=Actinoplanes regularis TaxID=52697 RepID=A0A238Z319_9ACTN|nr:hypothetical protein [Actinoplanes regularis]GIE85781.1 hypothetical protein Are01nite_22610 [Actinoplanes regularis]SNR77787.1 hypothetical protein SAMN06264365_105397 [Actinoplanes regularis]
MIALRKLRQRDRSRYIWAAAVLLAGTLGVAALADSDRSRAEPADLQAQIVTRMRATLEQSGPETHNHAGHGTQQATAGGAAKPAVICGIRLYGYEPTGASRLAEIRTVYGFHLCGVAEPKQPWDVAVKLAGPVILDLSTDPVGIQVVEATAEVKYVDRLRQMFPDKYAQLALKEALTETEMADLHRRYATAADQ